MPVGFGHINGLGASVLAAELFAFTDEVLGLAEKLVLELWRASQYQTAAQDEGNRPREPFLPCPAQMSPDVWVHR